MKTMTMEKTLKSPWVASVQSSFAVNHDPSSCLFTSMTPKGPNTELDGSETNLDDFKTKSDNLKTKSSQSVIVRDFNLFEFSWVNLSQQGR